MYTNVVAGISLDFAAEAAVVLNKTVPAEWRRFAQPRDSWTRN